MPAGQPPPSTNSASRSVASDALTSSRHSRHARSTRTQAPQDCLPPQTLPRRRPLWETGGMRQETLSPRQTDDEVRAIEAWALGFPVHLVEPRRVLEATQRDVPLVREQEPLAHGQLSHDVGGQYLSRLGVRAHSSGQLDGGAEQVLVLGDRLAGVEADAHADWLLPLCVVAASEGLLDSDRALQGMRGGGERRHDAVARVLDLIGAVGLQPLADQLVMGAQELVGLGVAPALGEGGRTLHVREQDSERRAADGGRRGNSGLLIFRQELLDSLAEDLILRLVRLHGVVSTLQRQEAGAGGKGGQLPPALKGEGALVPAVDDQRGHVDPGQKVCHVDPDQGGEERRDAFGGGRVALKLSEPADRFPISVGHEHAGEELAVRGKIAAPSHPYQADHRLNLLLAFLDIGGAGKGAVEDEAADAVGGPEGVGNSGWSTFRPAEDRALLDAQGIDDRLQVSDLGVQAEVLDVAVR